MTNRYVTWYQVNEYAEKVAQRIVSTLGRIPARIYPIQTVDGIYAAQSVLTASRIHTFYPNATIVDELQDANVILDAVERTGLTKKNMLQCNKDILLFDTLIKAEEGVIYIFPWNTIDLHTVRTIFPVSNVIARNSTITTRIEDNTNEN